MEAFSHIIFDLEMVDGRGCLPFFCAAAGRVDHRRIDTGRENLNGPQPAYFETVASPNGILLSGLSGPQLVSLDGSRCP